MSDGYCQTDSNHRLLDTLDNGGWVLEEKAVLEDLGLTETEARIYIALLETGSCLAGAVIKKTGLHRATTYQILQRLKEKGFVTSIIKEKKQNFQAVEPERLLDMMREREENLKEIMPRLVARASLSREKQDVSVYYGVKGIRSVLYKVIEELKTGGIYYDFGVSGLFREVMSQHWERWQKLKKRYKIKSYVIFNEAVKEKDPALITAYYGEARFHPKEYASITDTMIYNDTVIIFIWTAKPPLAVLIKSKDNAESYKNQFQLLWKSAKRK